VDRAQLDRIDSALTAQMDAAVEFAVAAPYPELTEVDQDIYA